MVPSTRPRQDTGTHARCRPDDWLDRRATNAVLDLLREERPGTDLLSPTTSTTSRKGPRPSSVTATFRPRGRTFGWRDCGSRYDQYLMMHALTMRNEVVRASGLVSARSFYVDYLYRSCHALHLHDPLPDVDLPLLHRARRPVRQREGHDITFGLGLRQRATTRTAPARADVDGRWRFMVSLPAHQRRVCPSWLSSGLMPGIPGLKEQIWETMDQINPEATGSPAPGLSLAPYATPPEGRSCGGKVAAAIPGFN